MKQQLVISLWLPFGINNLIQSSEKVKEYLNANQERIKFTGWDGRISLHDTYFSFKLRFNSPYDKYSPATLMLDVQYYGWGYLKFALLPENNVTDTLGPNFVNENMRYMLPRVVELVSGTLLDHQKNYLSNVLFGNGILPIETYIEAALEGQLNNGIMDGATDDEIKLGFRYNSNLPETQERRNKDLLVKSFILKQTASLQVPMAYDDIDGDFDAFLEEYTQSYLRGRHRSLLVITNDSLSMDQEKLTDLAISFNSLVRFVRFLLDIMVSTRNQLSLVRIALLRKRGIKLDREIPQIVEKANQVHLQGYVLYLLSRIPLVDELVQFVSEAHAKANTLLEKAIYDRQTNDALVTELLSVKDYLDDLTQTTKRILEGLNDEIMSVSKLIEIHDEEEALDISTKSKKVLEEIRHTQVKIQKLAEIQATMQKRALETSFIQSEFARSNENRQRVGRTSTQVAGAATLSGLLTNVTKGIIVTILSVLGITLSNPVENLLDVALPSALAIFGWFAVGNLLSQTRKFGDIVEVIAPLDRQDLFPKPPKFNEQKLLKDRFKDDESKTPEKRLHRFRIEGNTYRITWEDQIPESNNHVFATIEYIHNGEETELLSIMMSAEKSQEDKSMLTLKEKIIKLAAKRLHSLCESDSEGKSMTDAEWETSLEKILTSGIYKNTV